MPLAPDPSDKAAWGTYLRAVSASWTDVPEVEDLREQIVTRAEKHGVCVGEWGAIVGDLELVIDRLLELLPPERRALVPEVLAASELDGWGDEDDDDYTLGELLDGLDVPPGTRFVAEDRP